MSQVTAPLLRRLGVADAALFPEALDLMNRTQGRDLFAPSYLDERVLEEASYVLAAFVGGAFAGIAIAQILSNFDYYVPFVPGIAGELRAKTVGSFSTMCVVESLQGQGVGQAMSRARLAWLKERRCEVILGVSWASGLAHTSDRVFEKMGFRAVERRERFYYESSLKKPFLCPGCGEPPCTCGAILYRMDLAPPKL